MGSITPYETKFGKKYRVRYRKPDRSQTDKRGFTTKRDAELYLASVEVAKARGNYIDPARARVTVAEWMAIYISTRADLRRSTLSRIEGVARLHINPALGQIPLSELTRLRCQQFVSTLNATQKPGSVHKTATVLSGALQLAVDDGRLPGNPASRLKLPRQMKQRKKFLTHQEVADLAAAVDAKPHGEGFGLLVYVLAYCGLRWGELAGLRVRDLDFKRRRLNVRETMVEVGGYFEQSVPKDYEERSIPVPEFIMDRLADHVAGKSSADRVFVSYRTQMPIRNRSFRRYWFDEAAVEIGIPGLTPHELRHTCASLAVSVGANVKAVQKMLGHASAAITLDVHADLFDEDLDGVATALNAAAARGEQIPDTSLLQGAQS
jgi:integrase